MFSLTKFVKETFNVILLVVVCPRILCKQLLNITSSFHLTVLIITSLAMPHDSVYFLSSLIVYTEPLFSDEGYVLHGTGYG